MEREACVRCGEREVERVLTPACSSNWRRCVLRACADDRGADRCADRCADRDTEEARPPEAREDFAEEVREVRDA